MRVIEESESSRIVSSLKAKKAERATWVWGCFGVVFVAVTVVFNRPVTLGGLLLAVMAAAAPIFAGLRMVEHHRRQAAGHHVRSLTTANKVLQAKVRLAMQERCPDERCSRCRAVIVQRRTDVIMEEFGRLGPGCDGS